MLYPFARIAFAAILLFVATTAQAQQFTLGSIATVPDARPGVPIYRYCLDGHLTLLKDEHNWQMYWAGSTSYRTTGTAIDAMTDPLAVLRPGERGEPDNGGAWLFSVYRKAGDKLLGFYHAEDHEFSAAPQSREIAWKSICSCTSEDNGRTWKKVGQIITSASAKPAAPTWGGCGDFDVIRDEKNDRWLCFYQEHFLMVASSSDAEGKPGTWKKYFGGEFVTPGLRGKSTPLPNLTNFPGGNPSVVFNSCLDAWLMVWHTWDQNSPHPNSIWIAHSSDLIHWLSPRVLVRAQGKERNWYPTLLGETDRDGGQKMRLCYAHFPDMDRSKRQFVIREIEFSRNADADAEP